MRTLVVYESMFGNTHTVAERIGEGLRGAGEARAVPVGDATPDVLEGVDLLVVGGPTHVHGMVSARSRKAARDQAAEHGSDLVLDTAAEGPTLGEWLDRVTLPAGCRAAAFDTRVHGAPMITGRASKGIAKRLERHGATMIADPESFFVTRENELDEGEEARAEAWGATLAGALAAVAGRAG